MSGFRPAKSTDVNFGLPRLLRAPLKNALTAHPRPDPGRCVRCGLCVKHCPPRAMAISEDTLHIDHQLCIRCFCCQELCPHDAIQVDQGWLLRLSRRFHGAE